MLADSKTPGKRHKFLKRFLYSQLGLRDSLMILLGREQPRVCFKVLSEPSSIYLNFTVREDMAKDFTAYINLAEGLQLTPVRCLPDEEPALLLTLNIYQVSGLVNGLRAEWSTYIRDKHGEPRYMVLEARAEEGSLDPVNLFTKADRVEHAMSDGVLKSTVASLDGELFHSEIRLDTSHPGTIPAREWIAANDYIYWRNGVCDRAWYNATLCNAPVKIVPDADISVDDSTHWARFVDPRPRHVLAYEGELEFMLTPWFNV